MVHGGLACTLLDSALRCAAHTLLPAGTGCTSVEIRITDRITAHHTGARHVESEGARLLRHYRVLPKPRRRSEFATTSTELTAIAAPAIIGLSSPKAAIGMPMVL